ncbi:helix-turn-helix transcriptional regulator [Ruania halotolerans]|uniref:helix-turn-helix transcriptional regulator n=1 Tax=Ruania halotolerans TaxID=2897773 RepID=UPI001E2C3099|nr:YafY family protein [Ruania halotolerans]UFU06094.1 YafY family transcriptional regulator [Ruania halotolerans]
MWPDRDRILWNDQGMADVTERMLALLSTLQSGRSFSAEELTGRLEISPRTLRRDIERLRGYGYPVQTRPGPGGYYRLVAGRSMPPLVLDDDEAIATSIALATLAAVGEPTDGGIDAAATRAYGKLDQFLPARLRPQLASIRASLETSQQRAPSLTAHQIATVAEAIAGRETLTFGYTDARGDRSDRRVEPYRQVHHLLRWYLMAFDLEREDWRVFRLDRIADPRRTGQRYHQRDLPADSALDYLRHGMATGKEPVTLIVDAPAADVADVLKYQDAEINSVPSGQTRVTLTPDSWHWLVLNLAFLGADFRIEAGAHARRACRTFGERLVAAASGATC